MQFPAGYASKSAQSEIEQLLSTRNIGSGLGGEQIVFPLLVPAPSVTPPLDVPEYVTPPLEQPVEDVTWAEEVTDAAKVDDVVINDEYLCSDVTSSVDERSPLELVLGEETSIPDLDNDLLNLLACDSNVFTEDKWDQVMNEPNPSSTDDALSSVGSLGDSGSLGDELLPPWDLDGVLLQPPVNKKPSRIVEPLLVQQPSSSTAAAQMHSASAYPSAPPPAVQQTKETIPSSNDIMVKLTVPGQPNLSVTLERDKLLSMPADRFNHLLDRSGLSENDVAYMKEWRRKGKNKMAAQQARKRKREEVDEMAVEINRLQEELVMLREEQQSLQVELEHYPRECHRLEHVILTNYQAQHDSTVTPDTHRIVLLSDTILVAPVVQ